MIRRIRNRRFNERSRKLEVSTARQPDYKEKQKRDALRDALNMSDKALEHFIEGQKLLSDAIRNAVDYGNAGAEIQPIRDCSNDMRELLRNLKRAIEDLEKNTVGYVINSR